MKWMRRKQGMRAKLASEGVHAFLKGEVSCFERRCFHLYVIHPKTEKTRIKHELKGKGVRIRR
jgi:hypothetical protein